jgi:hypothetical protein
MRLYYIVGISVLLGMWLCSSAVATPASSPPFTSQEFQQPDTSTMRLSSGLDVLGWYSFYQMFGTEPEKFGVTRMVNIHRREVEPHDRQWTFEEDVLFRRSQPIYSNLDLRTWVHANVYSDEYQNQMHWVQQGTGVALKPLEWAEIFPAFGIQEDSRQGYRDRGTLLTSSLSVEPPAWGNGSVSWGVEELGNRQNRDFEAQYRARGDFQTDTFDEFEAGYLQQHRAYYLSTGGDIARREETHRSIQNQLGYPLGKGHQLRINTSARDSRIQIASGTTHNEHKEVEAAIQASVLTAWRSYSGEISYEWNAQNQEYDQDRINGKHQALKLTGDIQLTSIDHLLLSASVLKNRFDTPDSLNYDDRDEWSTRTSITYIHPINRFLEWSQEVAVYLDHLVYIYSEKSENNNWRRVLRLESSLKSTPFNGVENRNGFLVTATYRDYDFDNRENPRSDVYRRFTAIDSLDLPIMRHFNCILIYQLDLEDRGLLNWSEWLEQISEEYRTHRMQAMVNYNSPLGWMLSAGWIETLRYGWQYSSTSANIRTRSLFQDIRTRGPTLSWNWFTNNIFEIQASGQWQRITDQERGDQSLLFADLNLRWSF